MSPVGTGLSCTKIWPVINTTVAAYMNYNCDLDADLLPKLALSFSVLCASLHCWPF